MKKSIIKSNMLAIWQFVTPDEKLDWYVGAHEIILDEIRVHYELTGHYYTIPQAIGVVAVFSPMCSWEQNLHKMREFLFFGRYKGMSAHLKKAKRILETRDAEEIAQIIRGEKTVSFYWNILRPSNTTYVTVDRHMIAIAIGKRGEFKITRLQYSIIRDGIIEAAKEVNMNPAAFQGAVWSAWRRDDLIKELKHNGFTTNRSKKKKSVKLSSLITGNMLTGADNPMTQMQKNLNK